MVKIMIYNIIGKKVKKQWELILKVAFDDINNF